MFSVLVVLVLATGLGGLTWVILDRTPDTLRDLLSEPIQTETRTVEVVRVVDGDTLIVDDDGTVERVRLLGIDAPEVARDSQPGEPRADEATELLTSLVAAGEVELVTDSTQPDRDRYDRLLAYVDAGGIDTGRALLDAGVAEVYESAPDIERYPLYKAAADDAEPAQCAS